MRNIIIHYHIFKNAGSSVDSILINNFGDLCGSVEGKNPWDTLNSNDILEYAINNPTLKVISSHHARLPEPISQNIVFHPLIFLRHPIDRVGSVYSYERRWPIISSSLGIKIAQEKNFAEYVKWRLSDGNGAVIKNFQTVHLSGREKDMRTARATNSDLKNAMERISQLTFFGIVELFDDSISKMSDYLFQNFGHLDRHCAFKNKSTERKSTIQERLDDIKTMLGPNLHQELLDKNALDIELYDYALRLFSQQSRE